ncbi:hypothetical protein NOCA1260027 [metagenome]|uniref:Uncharacterized protein n=1 Tax=metagenome TaxID=256318 RepID=A0A2P2CHX2_9ZZZZ
MLEFPIRHRRCPLEDGHAPHIVVPTHPIGTYLADVDVFEAVRTLVRKPLEGRGQVLSFDTGQRLLHKDSPPIRKERVAIEDTFRDYRDARLRACAPPVDAHREQQHLLKDVP